jgi:hypothetical protein
VVQDVDNITVFVRAGGHGAINGCVWDPADGRRWNWFSAQQLGWAPEPSGGTLSPAACSWAPDRLDLFAVSGNPDSGGKVEHTWQQDFPGAPHWHPDYWENAAGQDFTATSSPVR